MVILKGHRHLEGFSTEAARKQISEMGLGTQKEFAKFFFKPGHNTEVLTEITEHIRKWAAAI